VQRLHSHEFFFDQTHPWVGFHGQKEDGVITSLGLITYDSENVRCKPYSDVFLISLMQIFTIFDRDGNGEINSFEIKMLEEYFQAFGDQTIRLKHISQGLDFDLFCQYVHEGLLKETDEYN